MFKSLFQNYFGFNKQQRNGLYVLLLISFLLLVLRVAYPYLIKPDEILLLNLPLAERTLDSAMAKDTPNRPYRKKVIAIPGEKLVKFDPNTVSFEQLLLLGFKEKTAKTLIKFRERGFLFKQKEDLKKVYGITDSRYKQLAPYIVIAQRQELPAAAERMLAVELADPRENRKNLPSRKRN